MKSYLACSKNKALIDLLYGYWTCLDKYKYRLQTSFKNKRHRDLELWLSGTKKELQTVSVDINDLLLQL